MTIETDPDGCPLCGAESTVPFYTDRQRSYRQCVQCQLVYVPSSFHLSLAEEKAIYDLHNNGFEDSGYQNFLSRLSRPLLAKLSTPSTGLDFGCGPGPLLSHMMEQAGHKVALYDLHYANKPDILEVEYDFITMTEVAEHLKSPAITFSKLFGQLKPGGYLALMTKRMISLERFKTWHYKNDPTHIVFYADKTFQWLAQSHTATLEFHGQDVAIFQTAQSISACKSC